MHVVGCSEHQHAGRLLSKETRSNVDSLVQHLDCEGERWQDKALRLLGEPDVLHMDPWEPGQVPRNPTQHVGPRYQLRKVRQARGWSEMMLGCKLQGQALAT